jgi:hypothetical protein
VQGELGVCEDCEWIRDLGEDQQGEGLGESLDRARCSIREMDS